MDTHKDFIKAHRTIDVAHALDVSPQTVSNWIARDRIPAEHWLSFTDWCASINRPVSLERLAIAAKAARQ